MEVPPTIRLVKGFTLDCWVRSQDEDNPEITDWEIKWALEHGISFFVYCW